ncbi:hypothetical protein [Streptomyces sp. NPDC020965]|uniref:hypothetical protein n=1 Tax=Streptomyces sp. NPDC020965 TaxID=3365105 RepID=UPI0037B68A17
MASVWTSWAAGVRPISARRAGSSTSTWRTPSIVAGICTSWPSMRVVQVVFSSTAVRPPCRPPTVRFLELILRTVRAGIHAWERPTEPAGMVVF